MNKSDLGTHIGSLEDGPLGHFRTSCCWMCILEFDNKLTVGFVHWVYPTPKYKPQKSHAKIWSSPTSRKRVESTPDITAVSSLTHIVEEPRVRHARPAVGLQSAADSGRVIAGVESDAAGGGGRVGRASLHRGLHARHALLALVVRGARRQEDRARVLAGGRQGSRGQAHPRGVCDGGARELRDGDKDHQQERGLAAWAAAA